MVSEVVLRIRTMLRSQGLRAGDPLPGEAETALLLGASRTVIREAYRTMSALGLIDVGNGRRPRVGAVNPQSLALLLDHGVQTNQATVQQVLDVRRTIEIRTAGLAALLRKDSEAEEIAALAGAMRADFASGDKVMAHDIAFHEAIARASRNPVFLTVVASFGLVTRETWPIGWKARVDDQARLEHVQCHAMIADSIARGDRGQAEALMAAHFDNTAQALLASGIF
jgi:DNA-binding FadR family transcriptional regulator